MKNKAIGYCKLHDVVVQSRYVDKRGCIRKRCHHFVPYEDRMLKQQRVKSRRAEERAVIRQIMEATEEEENEQ